MRLDEWQKFIESQFVEESAPPAGEAPDSAPASRKADAAQAADDALPTGPAQEVLDSEPGDVSPFCAPGSAAAIPAADDSPRKPSPPTVARQTGFVVRSVVEDPADFPARLPARSPVPHEPELQFDPVIPDFSDYLPAKPPPIRSDGGAANSCPEEPPAEGDGGASGPGVGEPPVSGPISVLAPMTSGFVSASPGPAARAEGTVAAGRRRSRAPQARNVQPEAGPTGLASAELWAAVPRHVQTLLALERREEEREVAQSSYKRPFQEKRAQLIERILDPMLSLEDTARLLNVCPTTVRRYTNKGILSHIRKEPERPSSSGTDRETRQRRFRLSDILAFLETQQAAVEADRLHARAAPARRKRPDAQQILDTE